MSPVIIAPLSVVGVNLAWYTGWRSCAVVADPTAMFWIESNRVWLWEQAKMGKHHVEFERRNILIPIVLASSLRTTTRRHDTN